ncbi:MAG: hypothetical protein QW103_00385, partial [Candidatus Pacearchaeota archaeon]
FSGKKELKKIKEEISLSFGKVKEDFLKISEWITHFDGKNRNFEKEILDIKDRLNQIENEIFEIKENLIITNPKVFKHKQTAVYKQTAVEGVQTGVQTPVQTGILDKLTPSEKAIVLTLAYSEMKLSYEDLAAMLGKDKATIRGQINTIKQKSESLIKEITEKNGKKRVFVPEEIVKILLKNIKVRVKNKKTKEDNEKKES